MAKNWTTGLMGYLHIHLIVTLTYNICLVELKNIFGQIWYLFPDRVSYILLQWSVPVMCFLHYWAMDLSFFKGWNTMEPVRVCIQVQKYSCELLSGEFNILFSLLLSKLLSFLRTIPGDYVLLLLNECWISVTPSASIFSERRVTFRPPWPG